MTSAAAYGEGPQPRTVFVTGASRGVGREIARAFAAPGVRLALAGRDVPALEQTARLVEEAGAETTVLPFDATDSDACRTAVQETEQRFGPVTVLVNNAGIAESAPFLEIDDEAWRRTFAIDVEAPFALTQAVLPAMVRAGAGSVINIASIAAMRGLPYVASYTAAKHALLGLTRALAAEFARSGVTVNCVCPYFVDTEMTEVAITNVMAASGRTREQTLAKLANPQGRLVDPMEVAALCVFLASAAARSITGQSYNIDGRLVQG